MFDLMLAGLTPGDVLYLTGLLSFLFVGQLGLIWCNREDDKYHNELRAKHGLPPI